MRSMREQVPWVQVCVDAVRVGCLLFLVVSLARAKRKDDVVVMNNGDTFTGEVKELQYGELVFKSDYMKDSVRLNWKQVRSLRSKDNFIVALSDGRRVKGTIQKTG